MLKWQKQQNKAVSAVDVVFSAIKSISSNLNRVIPRQEMPGSELLQGKPAFVAANRAETVDQI